MFKLFTIFVFVILCPASDPSGGAIKRTDAGTIMPPTEYVTIQLSVETPIRGKQSIIFKVLKV